MLANATVCGPSGFAWTLGDDLGERFRKVLDRAATQRHALLEEEPITFGSCPEVYDYSNTRRYSTQEVCSSI